MEIITPACLFCPCGAKKQCLAASTTAVLVAERLWARHSDMPLKSDAWLLAVCSSQYFSAERSTVRPDVSHIMVPSTLLVFHSPTLLISVRFAALFHKVRRPGRIQSWPGLQGRRLLYFYFTLLSLIDLVTTTRVPSQRTGLTDLR